MEPYADAAPACVIDLMNGRGDCLQPSQPAKERRMQTASAHARQRRDGALWLSDKTPTFATDHPEPGAANQTIQPIPDVKPFKSPPNHFQNANRTTIISIQSTFQVRPAQSKLPNMTRGGILVPGQIEGSLAAGGGTLAHENAPGHIASC